MRRWIIGYPIKYLIIAVLLFLPVHLTASVKPYEEETIYQNHYSIGNEEAWDKHEADRIAKEAAEKRRVALQLQQTRQTVTQVQATGFSPCSCVSYAQYLGMPLRGYGAARNYPVNSQIPAASGFVITYESGLGHAAKYVLDGEYLVLQEANYKRCTVTQGRRLKVGSKVIKGYINP